MPGDGNEIREKSLRAVRSTIKPTALPWASTEPHGRVAGFAGSQSCAASTGLMMHNLNAYQCVIQIGVGRISTIAAVDISRAAILGVEGVIAIAAP